MRTASFGRTIEAERHRDRGKDRRGVIMPDTCVNRVREVEAKARKQARTSNHDSEGGSDDIINNDILVAADHNNTR